MVIVWLIPTAVYFRAHFRLLLSFLHNESDNLLCWLHKHCISIFCITLHWIPIGRMAVGHSKIVQQVYKLKKCHACLKRIYIFHFQDTKFIPLLLMVSNICFLISYVNKLISADLTGFRSWKTKRIWWTLHFAARKRWLVLQNGATSGQDWSSFSVWNSKTGNFRSDN